MGTTKVLSCNEEIEKHKTEIIKGTKFTFDVSNEKALSIYVKICNTAFKTNFEKYGKEQKIPKQ